MVAIEAQAGCLEAENPRLEEERAAAVALAEAELAAALAPQTELGAAGELATEAAASAIEEARRREVPESSLATALEEAAELRGTLGAI